MAEEDDKNRETIVRCQKGHGSKALLFCDKNAKDVQQRRLREVLLRLPDRMDAARDVDSGSMFKNNDVPYKVIDRWIRDIYRKDVPCRL